MVFSTEQGKWKAVVQEISHMHKKGRPVLVGTTSVERSEYLASQLDDAGIPYQVRLHFLSFRGPSDLVVSVCKDESTSLCPVSEVFRSAWCSVAHETALQDATVRSQLQQSGIGTLAVMAVTVLRQQDHPDPCTCDLLCQRLSAAAVRSTTGKHVTGCTTRDLFAFKCSC